MHGFSKLRDRASELHELAYNIASSDDTGAEAQGRLRECLEGAKVEVAVVDRMMRAFYRSNE